MIGDAFEGVAERVYACVLHLYPADYRSRFSAEMQTTFRQVLGEGRVARAFAGIALAEIATLLCAVAGEWVAKLTSDRTIRGRRLPDCRMMRPPGVTREQWAAGLDSD